MTQLYEKLFERLNRVIRQCVTPLSYAPFERENEQPTTNILIVDIVICAETKKMGGLLK